MSAKNILPTVAIGAGVIWAFSSFTTANSVSKLKVVGFKLKGFNIQATQAEITAMLAVENPNRIPVPIEYFSGDLLYGINKLASFSLTGNNTNTSLPKQQVSEVPFVIRVGNLNALILLAQIATKLAKKEPVNTVFSINAVLSAGGMNLPVQSSFNLKPQGLSGYDEAIGKFRFGFGARKKFGAILAQRKQKMLARRRGGQSANYRQGLHARRFSTATIKANWQRRLQRVQQRIQQLQQANQPVPQALQNALVRINTQLQNVGINPLFNTTTNLTTTNPTPTTSNPANIAPYGWSGNG